jgi:hypothetical protein
MDPRVMGQCQSDHVAVSHRGNRALPVCGRDPLEGPDPPVLHFLQALTPRETNRGRKLVDPLPDDGPPQRGERPAGPLAIVDLAQFRQDLDVQVPARSDRLGSFETSFERAGVHGSQSNRRQASGKTRRLVPSLIGKVDARRGPVEPVAFGVRPTVADQEEERHVRSICPGTSCGIVTEASHNLRGFAE